MLNNIIRFLSNYYLIFCSQRLENFIVIPQNKILKVLFFRARSRYFEKKSSFIGRNTKFNDNPVFPHGVLGIFISNNAEIGRNVTIFHQVTIGSNNLTGTKRKGSPKIGDNVYIGAGSKIIGGISVGNNVRIGANAVVVDDVPENSTVVMKKPKIILKKEKQDNTFIKV